jgi:hypothetical protein
MKGKDEVEMQTPIDDFGIFYRGIEKRASFP